MPEKLERPQYLLEMFLFLATLKFGHYGVATFGLWSYLLHPLLLVERDSSQAQMLRRLAARLKPCPDTNPHPGLVLILLRHFQISGGPPAK
jgi:hypothetical protein